MGFAALSIAGCGSSSSNSTDAATDHGATDATTDTRDSGIDRGPDLAVDRGFDLTPADVNVDHADSNGSICTGVAPNSPLIANFDGDNNTAFGVFGQDPVVGGTYVKTADPLVENFDALDWHLTGNVSSHHDLIGLYWSCAAAPSGGCTLNASQYAGIQFTIKGNAGPSGHIWFTVGRAENDTPGENAMCGTCVAPADAATSEDGCHGPRFEVPVTTAGNTVTLLWAELIGGSPKVTPDPHQLTGMLWFFNDPPPSADGGADAGTDAAVDAPAGDGGDAAAAGPSYPVDFAIDNVQFIPFP